MATFNHREESLENLSDKLDDAKKAVVTLMSDTAPNASDILTSQSLEQVESQIRTLNEYSNKCWLVSAIALYSLIYSQNLYKQSNLSWNEYLKESKKRLNMESRDISEQLSSARYFIKNHEELIQLGWNPSGSARKLARAEYAELLSGDHKATIDHVINDSVRDFKEWYSSFSEASLVHSKAVRESYSKNYTYKNDSYFVDGIDAIQINDTLDKKDKERLNGYLRQIFEYIQCGKEPAIIPVDDNEDASKILDFAKKLK